MIQTSAPKINSLSFRARHAKIIDMEKTINGDTIYTYEFSVTVSTSLALTYEIATLSVKAKPLPPSKSMPKSLSVENLNSLNYIKNTATPAAAHLDTVAMVHTPVPTPGGALMQEQVSSLANNNTLPGFGGSFSSQSPQTLPDFSSTALSAVLNFDRLYRSFLISKAVASFITDIAAVNVSVNGFIDTRVADNFKNNISGNGVSIKSSQKTSLFSPIHSGIPNTNFYTGAPVVKLVKSNAIPSTAPNLTTVVNSAYGYTDIVSSSPSEKYFERGPGNSVKATNTQTGLNNNNVSIPRGITNLDTRNIGSNGSNAFLPDFRSAAVRSIFDFGIAPSSLIPVNVDNTIVSVMQNFQGTSNLKNNGS